MPWYGANVQIAFGANPAADPDDIPAAAWVDVSSDVASWSTSRGRSTELEDIQTGTGKLTLHNDDRQYSPGYNPADGNLIEPDRQGAGESLAGVLPEGVQLSTGLTGVTLTCAATDDADFQHRFAYQITVTGGATGTPKLFTGDDSDTVAGPFTLGQVFRVEPSTAYKFSFQHKLISGTGTSVTSNIHWLDSDGVILSTDGTAAFTPTGTVTQSNKGATSPAGARYAALSIQYSGVPGAAHVYQFTALQLIEGSSTTLLDPVHYPNIRPRVPVRIGVGSSDSEDGYTDLYTDYYLGAVDSISYQYVFYGFTGEWTEDVDGFSVSVDLVDSAELLAAVDLTTAAAELVELIDPLVSVPLIDPSGTRNNFTVTARNDIALERKRMGTAAAGDLSEVTFGVEGPQDGITGVYLDPESATVGYSLRVKVPASLPLLDQTAFTAWGWFKIRHREHDGRTHSIVQVLGPAADALILTVKADETIRAAFEGPGSAGFPTFYVESVETYADGEFHFFAATKDLTGGSCNLSVWIDWDGTNGEALTNATGSGLMGLTSQSCELWIGDDTSTANALPRATISQVGVVDRVLTDTELQGLYAAGAPPAIYPGEAEDVRLGRLLDIAGWPATRRDLDDGLSTLIGPHPSNTNLLDALKNTAESAGGIVYVNASGKVCYANRRHRYNPTTALTCSSTTQTEPENDIVPSIGSDWVYNKIRVSRASGDALMVEDTHSQSRHGVGTLDVDLSLLSDDDAKQGANWILYQYAEPVPRVPAVTLNASAASTGTLWDFVITLDLMQNVVIDLGVDRFAGLLWYVEQIDFDLDAASKSFTATLQLSPAEKFLNICTLDDPDSGVLDSCVLGW